MENLVRIDKLKRERCSTREFRGLVSSAEARLLDATKPTLAPDSRFDLAYNAAFALALAALRYRGYRSDKRYVVFQVLPHTLGMPASTVRVLATCHDRRNRAEYEGLIDINETLISDLITEAQGLLSAVRELAPPGESA